MSPYSQSLNGIFCIAVLGLLSACATKPDFTNTANSLIQSDDMSFKLAGYSLLRAQHEKIEDLHQVVKEELLRLESDRDHSSQLMNGPKQLQCEFAGIDPQTKQAHYRNCRPARPANQPKP